MVNGTIKLARKMHHSVKVIFAHLLRRRAQDGGSYLVRLSLVQVANYLWDLGLVADRSLAQLSNNQEIAHYLEQVNTAFGRVEHLKPLL